LKREQIKIDYENNVIVYPHGTHYHYDRVDPNRPVNQGLNNNNHYDSEKYKNPEIETLKVLGPYALEDTSDIFSNDKLVKRLNIRGIKNVNNFNALVFRVSKNDETNENEGSFNLDSKNIKNAKNIIYLVKDGIDKSELKNIEVPKPVASKGYFFKDWEGDNVEEVVNKPVFRSANFRKEKHKDTRAFFGLSLDKPNISEKDADYRDYNVVNFAVIGNGKLRYNDVLSNKFFSFVRSDLTWKELKDKGYSFPEAVADEGYEFLGWGSKDFKIDDNEKLGKRVFLATFGTTKSVIDSYVPSDESNLLNREDPHRPAPRGNVFYDEDKYITVVLKADENGYLIHRGQKVKSIAYVVRKGTKWNDYKIFPPVAQGKEGYVADSSYIEMFKSSAEITEGVNVVKFTNQPPKVDNDYDDLFGSDDLITNEDEDLLGIGNFNDAFVDDVKDENLEEREEKLKLDETKNLDKDKSSIEKLEFSEKLTKDKTETDDKKLLEPKKEILEK